MDGTDVLRTDRFKRIQGGSLRICDKYYPVFKGINTVGRNKIATINVKHLNVSQNQAIIVLLDDQQHFISDLNSSNGTFLHDAELVPFKLYELTNNAKVTFGDVVGTYEKISNSSTTLNLTERAEMTQDITQNFYAANTQLIFNETNCNQSHEHSYFNSLQKENQLSSAISDDIHEMNTQVVEFPQQSIQRVAETHNTQQLIQTERLETCVVEELVDTFIHDAPTQVVDFSEQKRFNQSLPKANCGILSAKKCEDINVITGFKEPQIDSSVAQINELETSLVPKDSNNFESHKSSSEEATQILNQDETQRALEVINTSSKDIQNEQQQSHDSHSIETSLNSGSGGVSEILKNEDEAQNAFEVLNTSLQKVSQGKQQKTTVFHSSQTPCSSGLNKDRIFENDESFMDCRRPSTLHGEIEDTFIEESVSNDSVDFLTMQLHNDDCKESIEEDESRNESPISENRLKNISQESDMFHKSKKPIPKLPSERSSICDEEEKMFNSGSETDIENSGDIKHKIKSKKLNSDKVKSHKKAGSRQKGLTVNSDDSDTDIDGTQDIGFKKKPLRKLNSDEDLTEPNNSGHVSNIECGERVEDKVLQNEILNFDSGSDTDIEVEKRKSDANDGDLNDTDCIPATQDAFAEAFDYKAQRTTQNSCNQSSEESFKLGITELLEDNIENRVDIEINRNNKSSDIENSNQNNNDLDEKNDDQIFVNVEKSHILGKEKNDEILGCINEEISSSGKDKAHDNIYILPTQKIRREVDEPTTSVSGHCPEQTIEATPNDEGGNNDVYLMETQKLHSERDVFKAPSKVFTFKKKTVNLEESLTTILSSNKKDEEDIYLMATQKTEEKNDEDIYSMATQNMNEPEPLVENRKDDDIYSIATQIINEPKPLQDKNDDVYMQATQKLENEQENKKHDIFSQPTQCLNLEKQYKHVQSKVNEKTEDIYMAATQQMDGLSKDSYSEVNSYLSKEPEDPYMQNTQQIQQDDQEIVKTAKSNNDDATNLPSTSKNIQKLDIQDTQSEMPFNDDTIPLVVTESSNRPTNPLIHILNDQSMSEDEEKLVGSSTKRSRNIQEDTPESPTKKIKSVHKESSLENIESNSYKNDVETLSQIEKFIKKPLEIVPVSRRSSRRTDPVVMEEPANQKDDVETLSQIEAFIKKPMEVPKYRKSMRTERKTVVEEKTDNSETLSQIEAFIKRPQSVTEGKKGEFVGKEIRNSGRRKSQLESSTPTENDIKDNQRVSRRISSRRQSNNRGDINAITGRDELDVIKEYNETDDFEELSERSSKTKGKQEAQSGIIDDETLEKSRDSEDNSRCQEVKSDVDQSFALLESKCSKVRKQPKKDLVLGDIKVSITSHRRSMGTAEISKKSITELFPSRKSSRRTTVNSNELPTTSNKSKRKAETITKSKKKSATDSDCSDSEIETKIPRKSSKVEIQKDSLKKPQPSSSNRVSRITITKDIDDIDHKSIDSHEPSTSDTSQMNKETSKIKRNGKSKMSSTSEESDANELSNDKNKNGNVSVPSRKMNRIPNPKIQSTSEESDVPNAPTTPLKQKTRPTKDSNSNLNETIATPRRGQRSVATESLLSSAERSKRKQKPKVVFTMLESPQLESYIKHLGGSVVDTVDSSTVLVTEHVKRSQKLLTAVAQGKPICSPQWIHASKNVNDFVDPWGYILTDKEAETKWEFSLKESLIRAANKKLLSNYTFQLMVTNAADVLKGAIEASGGKCVSRNPGKSSEDKFVIVASPEHKTKYTKMKKQNPDITIVEPEAIFDGVLRQELRFSRHLLS